ncbi:RING-H2 finger protein ATL1-like [Diospyros lotus]|uniref:RING-H2 finger protein ATL1-like n=1 Tax=Diospyros lotus TaxID=55363 RepID=UPI00224CF889|nr:RING-H2 finger protein ATL1-like [Diospyros lotus]
MGKMQPYSTSEESPPMSSFSTSLLVSLLGIALTSLALLIYHLLVVKYCSRRRHHSGIPAPPPPSCPPATAGVDEKVLDAIPVLAYSAQNRHLFLLDHKECAVCLGELEEGEIVRLLPNCSHPFHVHCIDQWLMGNASCPLCRSAVAPFKDQTLGARVYDQEGESMAEGVQTGGSSGMLRHCASMALPGEGHGERLPPAGRLDVGLKLKRSLSMDQSYLVIQMERENERTCSSSSSSKADVMRHLDRVSSTLLRSFTPRFKMEKGASANGHLLPH